MNEVGLTGWLDVSDEYDGSDSFICTGIELFSDGPYLGTWQSVTEALRKFDGKHVTITIQEVAV